MKIIRDALTLLRRSGGERATSLQVRLFAFFALFAAALVITGFLILTLTGVFNTAEQRHGMWLDAEIGHLQSAVADDYGRLSLRGVAFARTLAANIQTWARNNEIAENEIAARPELIESLLAEQAASLLAVLENNTCSGVFIILDAATNPSSENAAYSRAGLFFTRREPGSFTSVSPKIYCLRGPASIARTNGAELLGQWRMDFDVGGMDFYEKVLAAARENSGADLSRLYYWSERYLMDGDSEHCMMLCVPLIARDGTAYGLCGAVVSDMLFKRLYSPRSTEYPRVFTAFAPADGNNLDAGAGLIAGNSFLTSQTAGLLTIENRRRGVERWRSGDGGDAYAGRTETLRLYPSGSPFANETWALALLMPEPDWASAVNQSNYLFYGAILALLAASLLAAVFISRRYIRPVVSALDLIKSNSRGGIKKTQITEIDDLLEYLASLDGERRALSEENETLAAELEQAKLRAEGQGTGSPVVTAYEQFRKNLDTLTATEQAVFGLYMKNYTAQQIADELFITINTVKFHNRNIYSKLGVSSLKELMVYVNMMKN